MHRTIGPSRRGGRRPRASGFTLIELILVMAVLLIAMSVAAPSLANFFRGRVLDAEARRFLSLTRYGQSRAVSEGVPMVLWIDPEQRAYGLEPAGGYAVTETNALRYELGETVQVDVGLPSELSGPVALANVVLPDTVAAIRFQPDGFIGAASPLQIALHEEGRYAIWISQSLNRLRYEIQTNASTLALP